MPSLADIPEYLLPIENKIEFMAWLDDLPLSPDAKKELMSLWAEYNATHFTREDYNLIVGEEW